MTPNRTTTLLRLGAAAAALATVVACGGPSGSEAPKDASQEKFCALMGDLDLSDPEELVDDMVEIGTPEGIPAKARDGFEVMIDKATDSKISSSDQSKVTAFVGYVGTTCGGL